jgi:SAM-dependent methyltransferase
VHEHERFDAEAATWDDDPGHEQRQVAVARAIEEVLDLDPRMRALDVGGGTGRLSILLADRVGSAVVTDPSDGMVQVARQRIEEAGLGNRLTAVRADLTTDRLGGTYDVVWSSMALHHVQDLDGLLRSVAGLLVDGGWLAIADLDEDPDGAFHADVADFDGHHGFNRGRLTAQLARAGFANISFVDATAIPKGDREFGVFLCTATKGHEQRQSGRYRVTIDQLERSVHIPLEDQTIMQPAEPTAPAGSDWDDERRQLRLAGGA